MGKKYTFKVILAGEGPAFLNPTSPISLQFDFLNVSYLGWDIVVQLWRFPNANQHRFMNDAYLAGSNYAILFPDLNKTSKIERIERIEKYWEWAEKLRKNDKKLPFVIVLDTDAGPRPQSVYKEVSEFSRQAGNAEIKYVSFKSGQAVEEVFKPLIESIMKENRYEVDPDKDVFVWKFEKSRKGVL